MTDNVRPRISTLPVAKSRSARAVRPFWISARVDGRASRIESGPRSGNGGFEITIFMRDRGRIGEAVNVRGYRHDDGTLRLWVNGPHGVRALYLATDPQRERGKCQS